MAKTLSSLTKKEWSRIKKTAGIEKNKGLLKSDASVGKYIEAYQKARNNLASAPTKRTTLKFISSIEALQAAFESFLKNKDLTKEEGKALNKDIEMWIKTLQARHKAMSKAAVELNKKGAFEKMDKDQLDKVIDQFFMG